MFRNLAAAKFDFENSFHINNITKKKLVFFLTFHIVGLWVPGHKQCI